MLQLISNAARATAAASLLGAALLAGPAGAASLDRPTQVAPVQLAADTTAAPAKPRRSPEERAEAHIKSLHERLHITAAQEPQWNALAQVMRDNAQHMHMAITQRQEAAKTLTALDDLKAYQAIADAHAQGLQKLIPAFEALYAVMSDEQKGNADAVFSQSRGHRHRMKK
jgi:hypothetical protein